MQYYNFYIMHTQTTTLIPCAHTGYIQVCYETDKRFSFVKIRLDTCKSLHCKSGGPVGKKTIEKKTI